jgi:hypothetical protein
MVTRRICSFVAGVLLLASCVPAAAQSTGSSRPFQGALFGPQSTKTSSTSLDASGLLLQAYDDNLFATLGEGVDPRSRPASGFYTMLLPGIDYRFAHPRWQVGVTGLSALGYYPDLHEVRSISHNGGAGFSAQLGRTTTLFVNQTAAYSPSYLYGLFPSAPDSTPGEPMPDAPNYAVSDAESYSYGTTATLDFGLSRRVTGSLGGNYRYTDFTRESSVQRDQRAQGFDGQISYQRYRNLGFRFGYHYSAGNFGYAGAVDTDEHRLDLGFYYSRPLSASRRMNLGFNLGPAIVLSRDTPVLLEVPDRMYRTSMDASLDYPVARSWSVRGTVRRGLEFVPGLAQPVYANGFTLGVDGLPNRRVEVGLAAGYSQGRSVLYAASDYDTYNASTYLQYAIGRSTAIRAEYLYYFYDFRGDLLLVSGAPRHLARNGVRIGLRFFLPAFRG